MKNHKSYQLSFVVFFLLILVLPVLNINFEQNSKFENRRLAQIPQFWVNGNINPKFAKETENWLRDRFGGRGILLDANSIAEASIEDWNNHMAIKGEDGWLFYKQGNSINNYLNRDVFTPKQMENIKEVTLRKKALLKAQGIDYYLIICPDKNRVYGEYYPSYYQSEMFPKANSKGRAEALVDYLRAEGVDVVYPLDALQAAKLPVNEVMPVNYSGHGPVNVLYYRLDTHWNTHGAFVGYQELMKAIQKDRPELKYLDYDSFNIVHKAEPCQDLDYESGDLFRAYYNINVEQLGLTFNATDTMQPKNGSFHYHVDYIKGFEGRKGVITSNNAPLNNLRVQVVRDSFFVEMLPFFSDSFTHVEYIWDHEFGKYLDKFAKDKPDIVIEEVVERQLPNIANNLGGK